MFSEKGLAIFANLNKSLNLIVSGMSLSIPEFNRKKSMAKTILILIANPRDTVKLEVNQEFEAIEKIFEGNHQFIVKKKLAATPNDLSKALLTYQPNIVHFIGHGEGEEGINLVNENGLCFLVNTKKLCGIFELFSSQIECVFLNACHSIVQAKSMVKQIEYVIGMQDEIEDKTSKAFATAFYQAIVTNDNYEFAFAYARQVIDLQGLSDLNIPKLLNKSKALKINLPTDRKQPAYLLIELAPKNKNNKYYAVQAWLFSSAENIRKIYVEDKAMPLNEIPALIEEILGIIDGLNVNHQQLTIEFILPRHLLSHHVEQWTDGNGEPLGINYRVVVRSRERLREKRLQRFWRPSWDEAQKKGALQQTAKTSTVIVDETQLRKCRTLVDAGKLCFVLASVPQVLTELKKEVFFALTKSGVPIALWPRQFNNKHELKQALGKLLSCTLEQLPHCLFESRRHLWENEHEQHTGYHLSLLWDDPNRIPPELQDDPNKVPLELQKLSAPN